MKTQKYHRLPIEEALSCEAIALLSKVLGSRDCAIASDRANCELDNLRNLCDSFLQHKEAGGLFSRAAQSEIDPLLE
jgi:hypothetical protein